MPLRLLAACLVTTLMVLGSASLALAQDADEAPKETEAQRALRLAHEAAEEARARAAAAAQEQITATNAEIQRLKDEISKLEKDLNSTTAQKQTLQNAIKALDLQIQKLQKSVSLTTTQISQKDKEITRLSGDISETEGEILQARAGVAESLRKLEQMDQNSIVTSILGGGTLSSFFDEAVAFESLRGELQERILELNDLKTDLNDDKKTEEQKRKELANLKASLDQQRKGAAAAKADQSTLLTQTKNKESEYQALIEKKRAEQAKFEEELSNFEAQLGLAVSAGSIPVARAGTLQWPLASVRITQYFGNTSFATQNPQIYGGKGHNAIDMAASNGTTVKAARGGVVLGTGNTDATCPNASYGKWVFIKHDNGLSTLYAHLSTISVSTGQEVETGEAVGYSGNTGYSTGPHLHFSVYASSGSKISSFPSSSCRGKTYTMPVADPSAYLNPLSYLPAR